MNEIRNHFYRVSVKALVLNEARDKFLIVKESKGFWELPGGGIDWGEAPKEGLVREIREEMKLETTFVAEHPVYFLACLKKSSNLWIANVLYETELKSLDFTPTEECMEIKFVDKNDIDDIEGALENVQTFAQQFDPSRHKKE